MRRTCSSLVSAGAMFAALGCAGSPPSFPSAGSSDDTGTTGIASTAATAEPLDDGVSSTSAAETAASDDTASVPSTGEASTGEPTVTETSAMESTGGEDLCARPHTIELTAEDAVLTGDWTLIRSMLGEGMVLVPGALGEATFTADLPCPATWHVWVRINDGGNDDSYFVQVDGQPMEVDAAIFEGDCTPAPNMSTYIWAELNYRPAGANNCEYLYDPWTFDTGPGPIVVAFRRREPGAIAGVIFTDVPDFVPPP